MSVSIDDEGEAWLCTASMACIGRALLAPEPEGQDGAVGCDSCGAPAGEWCTEECRCEECPTPVEVG